MKGHDAIVIGGGPAGLATAAELGARGLAALVLEKGPAVGATWRGHYDRLRLHTVRWLSGLPGLRIPRSSGRWVARDGVVAYLEAYARHHRLEIRAGTEARGLVRRGDGWEVETGTSVLRAPAVVVATGANRVPRLPPWPGRDGYTGRLLHSSAYRTGAAFRGEDVLVVGAGNSGAEIAVDLVECGAARVRLAIRTPPNLVRRTVGGLPTQAVSIALAHLPLPVADAIARATARLVVGDLTPYGIPRAERGIYTQMTRDHQIPIIDVGLIDLLRARLVEVVPRVEAFEGASVRLGDGSRIEPRAVVAATGYEPGLGSLLAGLELLRDDGTPSIHGAATAPSAPGLRILGFTVPPTGLLREIGIEARRIADAVAAERPRRREIH